MKHKIILLCPYPVVTAGVLSLLEGSPRFVCADTATTVEQAVHLLRHHRAPLLLADPALLLSSDEELPSGTTAVALVTHYVEHDSLAHFAGVVELGFDARRLHEVLEQAVQQSAPSTAPRTTDYELSQREKEVLVLLAQGMQNKEIADHLFISVHTVMSHRKNIIAKTGIRSVAGLTVFAMVNKLIDENDLK